jgi:hypothetical protein
MHKTLSQEVWSREYMLNLINWPGYWAPETFFYTSPNMKEFRKVYKDLAFEHDAGPAQIPLIRQMKKFSISAPILISYAQYEKWHRKFKPEYTQYKEEMNRIIRKYEKRWIKEF